MLMLVSTVWPRRGKLSNGNRRVALFLALASAASMVAGAEKPGEGLKARPIVAFEQIDKLTPDKLAISPVQEGQPCRCGEHFGAVSVDANNKKACLTGDRFQNDCAAHGVQVLKASDYTFVDYDEIARQLGLLNGADGSLEANLLSALATGTMTHALAAILKTSSEPIENLECKSEPLCPTDNGTANCCLRIKLDELFARSRRLEEIEARLDKLDGGGGAGSQ